MKFSIKSTYAQPEFIGEARIWGSGQSPYVNLNDQLSQTMVDSIKGIIRFKTGLDIKDIDSNQHLNKEEKEIYKETAKKLIEVILSTYPEASDNTNQSFWNSDRSLLKLDNFTESIVYDTDEPEGAILYLNIIAGGFPSVSPTLEIAQRNQNKFYLTSPEEFIKKVTQETYGDKRKAMAALNDLLENKGKEALVYISYLLTGKSKGWTMSTSEAKLEQEIMDFIEGKHSDINKKGAAKEFYNLYLQYKIDKDQVIGKAIIEAGKFFGTLQFPKGSKKLTNMITGTELGSNTEQAYKKLMKAENQKEFKELADIVKEKLGT